MELVDITPEDSIVPVYLEVLDKDEQAERELNLLKMQEEQKAFEDQIKAKEEAKQRGIEILQSLGLDEEAAKAIAGL